MRTVRFLMAVAAGAVVTLASPGVAHASKTITATAASSAVCSSGQVAVGGRFTLGAASSSTQHITVNTELSALDRGQPSSTGSGSAITNTYDVAFDAPFKASKPASAFNMPDNWNNTFQLVSVTCKTAVAATVAAQVSLPGVDPSIHVVVTNPNDIAAYYEVGGPSLGSKTMWVPAHGSNPVDLPASCSVTYQVVAKDGFGTQATASAIMPACAPGTLPPPAATPTPTKAAPHPSASASPSPSDSAAPDSSASTQVGDFAPPIVQGGVDPNALPATPHKTENSKWEVLGYKSTWIGFGLVLVVVICCAIAIRRYKTHSHDDENP